MRYTISSKSYMRIYALCLHTIDTCLKYIMIGIIRIYQNIFSPLKFYLFGPSCRCRFRVTCSNYAVQMYKTHNCLVATYLTIKRILHCNPFSEVEDE